MSLLKNVVLIMGALPIIVDYNGVFWDKLGRTTLTPEEFALLRRLFVDDSVIIEHPNQTFMIRARQYSSEKNSPYLFAEFWKMMVKHGYWKGFKDAEEKDV